MFIKLETMIREAIADALDKWWSQGGLINDIIGPDVEKIHATLDSFTNMLRGFEERIKAIEGRVLDLEIDAELGINMENK